MQNDAAEAEMAVIRWSNARTPKEAPSAEMEMTQADQKVRFGFPWSEAICPTISQCEDHIIWKGIPSVDETELVFQ